MTGYVFVLYMLGQIQPAPAPVTVIGVVAVFAHKDRCDRSAESYRAINKLPYASFECKREEFYGDER